MYEKQWKKEDDLVKTLRPEDQIWVALPYDMQGGGHCGAPAIVIRASNRTQANEIAQKHCPWGYSLTLTPPISNSN